MEIDMTIDINTKLITLLGTPLGQSFSARMQNRAYGEMGENMMYTYTECDEKHLGEIVSGIRHMPYRGFAVTKPNKVEVLQYLDELDLLCEKMGACNTVLVTQEGKLRGYNTDGIGFYRSICEALTGEKNDAEAIVQRSRYFIMGCGGAGRAIASILAYHGAKDMYLVDIHNERAGALAADLRDNFDCPAKQVTYGDYSKAADCDVVINATGVGMGHSMGENPMPKEMRKAGKLYFDACYNPLKTQFLLDAESCGGHILNGLGMVLYQAVAQIELWTGKEAPIEAMKDELFNILAEI